MSSEFIADVAAWEGKEMAEATARRLPISPSAFMAVFEARREVMALSLSRSQAILAEPCDSQKA